MMMNITKDTYVSPADKELPCSSCVALAFLSLCVLFQTPSRLPDSFSFAEVVDTTRLRSVSSLAKSSDR